MDDFKIVSCIDETVVKNEETDIALEGVETLEVYINKEKVTEELEVNTPQKVIHHKCFICTENFDCEYKLTNHMAVHTTTKPSDIVLEGVETLEVYIKEEKVSEEFEVNTPQKVIHHKCFICTENFDCELKLTNHMAVHTTTKPSDIVLEGVETLEVYIKEEKVSEEFEVNTPQKVIHHKCFICTENFDCELKLTNHMEVHTTTKPSDIVLEGVETLEVNIKEEKVTEEFEVNIPQKVIHHKCFICTENFDCELKLTNHMAVHTTTKPSDIVLEGVETLEVYIKEEKVTEEFEVNTPQKFIHHKCFICTENFDCELKLTNHMAVHNTTMPSEHSQLELPQTETMGFLCNDDKVSLQKNDVCDFKCTQRSKLKRHLMTHTGEKPFWCHLCEYKCSKSSKLKRHIMTHTGEKPFSCKMCNYKSTHNSSLKRHVMTHTGEKPFTCEVCDYKCSERGKLERHLRVHTGEKPFTCEVCDYKCSERGKLERHLRVHTGEKPYACKFCGFKCFENRNLKIHVRIHTGERPFSCHLCNFKFSQKSSLKRHIGTHVTERQFVCEFCDYKSFQKCALQVHLRTHTGEKPSHTGGKSYSCTVCNNKFYKKGTLDLHLKAHDGVRSYSCNICGYKCLHKSTLQRHLMIHTGEKPFSCGVCGYKCYRKDYLTKHIKVHSREDLLV